MNAGLAAMAPQQRVLPLAAPFVPDTLDANIGGRSYSGTRRTPLVLATVPSLMAHVARRWEVPYEAPRRLSACGYLSRNSRP
jgi:hypothetical protein